MTETISLPSDHTVTLSGAHLSGASYLKHPVPAVYAHPLQGLYVRILLLLLPTLLNVCRHFCESIQTEMDYLEPGFTFKIEVAGTNLGCVCRKTEKRTFQRVPASKIAKDVEPGSSMPSNNPWAYTVDYVITFRSLAYAFECFIGSKTLKEALAQRAFSTRGPNDAGVALTYMFIALLTMFFFWRAPYRKGM